MEMKRFARFLYQPVLPMGKDGKLATGSPEHCLLSKEAALEGMVLLKNDNGILPLPAGSPVAIFGTAQFDYVRGGGGSGDVTTAYTRNIYEGFHILEEQGLVRICAPVSDFYRKACESQSEGRAFGQRCSLPLLGEELLQEAAAFTDTALLTLCRYSWEGADRKGGLEDGDYYLNSAERQLAEQLASHFSKVVVILDVGGVIDSSWFKNDKRIGAVLMAWQAGIEGGLAIAETVCGLSNPSGRLVDTFADSFMAYPSSQHFNDSTEYADYTEDIYVGYRYFESFPGEKTHVNYPFGFGLSYTEFCSSVDSTDFPSEDEILTRPVTVRVKVTNTGSRPGKEAIGLYCQAPDGLLGKASRSLAAFAKTPLLAPGQSCLTELSFNMKELASFDDLGLISKSCMLLEAGVYRFYLGADVDRAVLIDDSISLSANIITEQLHSYCTPHHLACRLVKDGSFQPLPADDSPIDGRSISYNDWTVPTGRTITGSLSSAVSCSGTGIDASEFTRKEEIPDLGDVLSGKKTAKEFLHSLPAEVIIEMLGGQPNTGVANTFNMGNFTEFGIPSIPTADGPAGLRINPGVGVTTTAWPIATMLACTWNTELVEKVGRAGGLEVKENNIGMWLTPGMNIHRSPLCGRNFEYFSEDPLITGKMGAAMIRGIQSNRISVAMKHFCCNNKEENRMVCDSRVSERALREIYLRGFETAVKEADPWAIMSSYNKMNGHYNSENPELLTGILREEWGFKGMVTTDWMNWVGHVKEVKAGNDLKMPIGEPKLLLEAYRSGELTREDLEKCAGRILDTILKLD